MLDAGIAYLKANPKIAVAGGIGVLAVAYAIHRARTQAQQQQQTDSGLGSAGVSPYGDTYPTTNPLGGTQPGAIAGVIQGPTVVTEVPAKLTQKPGFVNIILNNLKTGIPENAVVRRKANPSHSCPPGYVLITTGAGKTSADLRCISANQPVTGSRYAKVQFTPQKPTSKTTKKAGGEGDYALPRLSTSQVPLGFVSPWSSHYAMELYNRSQDWGYHIDQARRS
jgi:hypothetical protein